MDYLSSIRHTYKVPDRPVPDLGGARSAWPAGYDILTGAEPVTVAFAQHYKHLVQAWKHIQTKLSYIQCIPADMRRLIKHHLVVLHITEEQKYGLNYKTTEVMCLGMLHQVGNMPYKLQEFNGNIGKAEWINFNNFGPTVYGVIRMYSNGFWFANPERLPSGTLRNGEAYPNGENTNFNCSDTFREYEALALACVAKFRGSRIPFLCQKLILQHCICNVNPCGTLP